MLNHASNILKRHNHNTKSCYQLVKTC